MRQRKLTYALVSASLAILLTGGCYSNTIRENIISTVNTGVGVQLAENPSTQLYEVKLGYLRNQFYSIPTAKSVNSPANTSSATNSLGTPEVVSGFGGTADVNSKSLGGGVAESFAVGSTAVNSAAAMMMYMATARSPDIAKAMADAISAIRNGSKTNNVVKVTVSTNQCSVSVYCAPPSAKEAGRPK